MCNGLGLYAAKRVCNSQQNYSSSPLSGQCVATAAVALTTSVRQCGHGTTLFPTTGDGRVLWSACVRATPLNVLWLRRFSLPCAVRFWKIIPTYEKIPKTIPSRVVYILIAHLPCGSWIGLVAGTHAFGTRGTYLDNHSSNRWEKPTRLIHRCCVVPPGTYVTTSRHVCGGNHNNNNNNYYYYYN
jgi:hypothetical protein